MGLVLGAALLSACCTNAVTFPGKIHEDAALRADGGGAGITMEDTHPNVTYYYDEGCMDDPREERKVMAMLEATIELRERLLAGSVKAGIYNQLLGRAHGALILIGGTSPPSRDRPPEATRASTSNRNTAFAEMDRIRADMASR